MKMSKRNKMYVVWSAFCLLISAFCYDWTTKIYLFNMFGTGEGIIIKNVALFPGWSQLAVIIIWIIIMFGVWKYGPKQDD